MSSFPRYAIYYVPAPDSDLYRFGSESIGYDAFSGADVAFPRSLTMAAPDWADVTADPRKYGFHATLKAPFSLTPETTEAELVGACAAFAKRARPIPAIQPEVRTISGFTAIVPSERSATLDTLAQDCVEAFDVFRAPMTPQDRARRHPERLTARQVAQLDRFGYPFVLDDFRFHMTLTSRLPDDRRTDVVAVLRKRFAILMSTQIEIDAVAILRQARSDQRFRVVERMRLG